MKINKFKKIGVDKYKVYIDDNTIVLYEDVIIKYNLLYKKDIDDKLLKDIEKDNLKSSIYDSAIKYIAFRMRSKKEIIEYLRKKEYSEKDINNTVDRLINNNMINDEIFCKSYINDKLNLSNVGINKIIGELSNLGIDENIINNNISNIDNEIIIVRLKNLIDKEIKLNNKVPTFKLKNKIVNKFITLGYRAEDIYEIINNINIKTNSDINKDYNILYKKYNNKYDEYKLKVFIKNKLYQKGYSVDDINNLFQ